MAVRMLRGLAMDLFEKLSLLQQGTEQICGVELSSYVASIQVPYSINMASHQGVQNLFFREVRGIVVIDSPDELRQHARSYYMIFCALESLGGVLIDSCLVSFLFQRLSRVEMRMRGF